MTKRSIKVETNEEQCRWQEKVLTWKKSDLSKTEFCRRHDLNSRQFSCWGLKHKKTAVFCPTSIVPVNIKKAFIPLRGGPGPGVSLLVTCLRATHRQRGEYRVEVSNDFDPITLRRLIQTVEGL